MPVCFALYGLSGGAEIEINGAVRLFCLYKGKEFYQGRNRGENGRRNGF